MQLSLMTWPEVDAHLASGICAVLPIGSIEQHGPMGLIGTDAICAFEIAKRSASIANAIVVPPLSYTPAPFNTAFPGTVSISPDLLALMIAQICTGLLDQGFLGVFIVNGHGANLDPISTAMAELPAGHVKVQSWWAADGVNALRQSLYGSWEGMHATPSEVAITQALYGTRSPGAASEPPAPLSPEYIAAHSGDRHGPPDQHRADFPDGRVGSHSALATPRDGEKFLEIASAAIAKEIEAFTDARQKA